MAAYDEILAEQVEMGGGRIAAVRAASAACVEEGAVEDSVVAAVSLALTAGGAAVAPPHAARARTIARSKDSVHRLGSPIRDCPLCISFRTDRCSSCGNI